MTEILPVNKQPSEAAAFLRERYSSAVEHLDWTVHEEGHLKINSRQHQSSNSNFSITALSHPI